jgi:hypothetical protein
LQKVKSYFFGNIYQSPFDSYRNSQKSIKLKPPRTHSLCGEGVGYQYLEDARHCSVLCDFTYEEEHGEDERNGGGRICLIIEVVKLELAQHHHEYLEEGLAGVLELLALVPEVDDEEGKPKRDHHDEEGQEVYSWEDKDFFTICQFRKFPRI